MQSNQSYGCTLDFQLIAPPAEEGYDVELSNGLFSPRFHGYGTTLEAAIHAVIDQAEGKPVEAVAIGGAEGK